MKKKKTKTKQRKEKGNNGLTRPAHTAHAGVCGMQ
jgi:hypothetical protein